MRKILLFILVFTSFNLFGQVRDERFPIVNSDVLGISNDGENTYLAGQFQVLAPFTGRGLEMDVNIPNYNSRFPAIPDGIVYTAETDGAGGWYVGGDFTLVGDIECKNIVHILSDGTIDENWIMDVNGDINDILIVGDALYVAGDFTEIKGLPRNYMAKINISDVSVDSEWRVNGSGEVNTIEVVGNNLFAGGEFSQIGGQQVQNAAKISQVDGTADGAWKPQLNGIVNKIVLDDESVYVAGLFSEGLVKLNNTDGSRQSWQFVSTSSQCNDLSIVGDNLYVCGFFDWLTDANGQVDFIGAAKIDKNTGLINRDWNIGFTSGANEGLAIEATEEFVFLGGTFIYPDFPRSQFLAKYDTEFGTRFSDWEVFMNTRIQSLDFNEN